VGQGLISKAGGSVRLYPKKVGTFEVIGNQFEDDFLGIYLGEEAVGVFGMLPKTISR